MGISETKKQIVIDNYFKNACDINTSIKEAFTKGFEVGLTKAVFPKEYETRLKDERKKIAEDVANKMDCIGSCPNEKNIILGVITDKRETTDSLCSACKSENCVSNGTAISKADYDAKLKTDMMTILDKIRTEIEQHAYPIVHGVNNHEKGMTLYGILQTIDKYKKEDKNAGCD